MIIKNNNGAVYDFWCITKSIQELSGITITKSLFIYVNELSALYLYFKNLIKLMSHFSN